MPGGNLNALSTYADDPTHALLKRAAKLENRSLSNFLLTAAIERAKKEHGLSLPDQAVSHDSA